jgi:hypothetical protein
MRSPYPVGGEDVVKSPGGLYPPLVCVETAVGMEVRVAVTPLPDRTLRARGSHGCHRFGSPAVADAPPEGAETGVEVQ